MEAIFITHDKDGKRVAIKNALAVSVYVYQDSEIIEYFAKDNNDGHLETKKVLNSPSKALKDVIIKRLDMIKDFKYDSYKKFEVRKYVFGKEYADYNHILPKFYCVDYALEEKGDIDMEAQFKIKSQNSDGTYNIDPLAFFVIIGNNKFEITYSDSENMVMYSFRRRYIINK